jgi:hypothetical protein
MVPWEAREGEANGGLHGRIWVTAIRRNRFGIPIEF